MKCPLCEGEFDPIELRTVFAGIVNAKQCVQCGGFWLEKELTEPLDQKSINQYESPKPDFSVKAFDLHCPLDGTLLSQSNYDEQVSGAKNWQCNDCGGQFYQKGQLALKTAATHKSTGHLISKKLNSRTQVASGVSLMAILIVSVMASLNSFGLEYSAASNSPLPTSGPNVLTLVLLAVAYLAGTVLAVLGRKMPIIVMGWSVIAVCVFGFGIVIFGP
ncbi:zf-TFIIB domain-containing protein [Candidatus Berkelbacteria bacterium]|nr:zf-TFIIB domain-containing protein [Candidatus Berkelbacteria bacterium]